MKTRILSAVVALPLLLFIVISGGIWLHVGVGLLGLIGMYEFNRAIAGEAGSRTKIAVWSNDPDVSLNIKKGEVIGLAGLLGSGRTYHCISVRFVLCGFHG